MDRDYGYSQCFFDFDKALPALVGHPFVFTEPEGGIPVDVVKGVPSLRVKKTRVSYHIAFSGGDSNSRSFIEKEAPGRHKVTTLTDDQMKIRDILGEKGITVPEIAKDKVLGRRSHRKKQGQGSRRKPEELDPALYIASH